MYIHGLAARGVHYFHRPGSILQAGVWEMILLLQEPAFFLNFLILLENMLPFFWEDSHLEVFGSAGVIGNPMGFARSVGLGISDFLSVPVRSLVKNPAGLFTDMAQGTTSLLSNTVYTISDAATQFSRVAYKGIVAFTFDDQSVAKMEKQQFGVSSHSKGVINKFLEVEGIVEVGR